MRTVIASMLVAAGIVAPARVYAFHGQADFAKPALEGGGGGRYFTGSPRYRRWDCTVCHEDAPSRIRLVVATDPPGLVGEARWVPEQTYRVTVTMQGEHRGLSASLNPNTIAFEMLDRDENPAGIFAGLAPEVERPPGEELIVGRGELDGVTEWSFEWIAGGAGTGPVTMYLAGVDGDGAGDRLGRTGDPFDDDVFVGSMEMQEEGNVEIEEAAATGGCAVAGPESAGGTGWAMLAMALGWLCVRRRRALAAAATIAALSGCHDPETGFDECARGICEAPRDSGNAGTDGAEPRRDGGAPASDAAPGADSGGVTRVDSGVDAGPPPDGCVPDWLCTSWNVVCSDDETRACTDANACGSDWGRPPETRALPALDESFFRCRVQPIYDRSCAQVACHGTEDRPLRTYGRSKWRINPAWRGNHVDGSPALTAEEWCRNFSSSRAFAAGDPASSQLLTQPLSPSLGGLAHAGYTLFYDTSDSDYQTIRQWLEGASLPSCDAGYND